MNRRNVTWYWIKYELRNVAGNPFVHIFGVLFPSLITIILASALGSDLLDSTYQNQVITNLFLGNGTIIPLATILIGYSSLYSQEIENKIPERMRLFGCTERCTICNRLIAEGIFLTFAYIIYFVVNVNVLNIAKPTAAGVIIYFVVSYVLSGILFIASHAIAGLVKKFGLTFLITMTLYFGIMILSGMMGVTKEMLPKGVQVISNLLPTTYMREDFYDIWVGNSYRYVPMIQSFLFLGAVSGILLFVLAYKNRRKLH